MPKAIEVVWYSEDMIKAVVFDFFDVIRSDSYNAWLKNHGFVREEGFLTASQKMDSGQIDMDSFFELLGSLSGQDSVSIKEEFKSVSKINHDVLDIISKLKSEYSIGLLSNAESKHLREILQNNYLEKYFDEIIISSEVGYIKPSKEIFDVMLNRMNLSASEVVFIDDSRSHIEGAEKSGIKGIQFLNAEQLVKDLRELGVVVMAS